MIASIIITSYNRSQTLKRALSSAIGQSYQDYEVIVIDDGSTDDTKEVVKKYQELSDKTRYYISYSRFSFYPKELRYYKHDKNKGLAAARNTGAKLSKGKYIVFLDDDDTIPENHLEWTIPILENIPDKKVVIGKRIIVYPEIIKHQLIPKIGPDILYTTLDDGYLIRKEIFNEIQYDEELLTNEDADFGIQYMQKYGWESIALLDNVLLIKYGHKAIQEEKTSYSYSSERVFIGMERFMKKNLKYYQNYPEELSYLFRMVGRLYCLGGKRKSGIRYFLKAFKVEKSRRNFNYLASAFLGNSFFRWFWKKEIRKLRFL